MLIRDVRHQNGVELARRAESSADYEIRRELLPGDAEAIVAMHDRLYRSEHERNDAFVGQVAENVARAVDRGWPAGGGVWIVERDGEVSGSLALTAEGDGEGTVRWVLLEPGLRGAGVGRRLLAEAIERARELGMARVTLDTFSDLRAAGRMYLDAGFRVVSERERTDWGPPITYQQYVLEL